MNPPESPERELTCPMCLQLFSEPVSLPCGHVFCLACLQALEEGLDRNSCPDCQAEYDGPAALVENLQMSSMVETYRANIGKTGSGSDTSSQIEPTDQDSSNPVNLGSDQNLAPAGGSHEGSDGSQEALASSPDQQEPDDKAKKKLDGPKFQLASQVTELNLKLEMAEEALKTEKELESEVMTANDQLRQKVSKLLEQIQVHSQRYVAEVTQMIEEELGPGEAAVSARVGQASELRQQLRRAMLRAESMLTEDDETAFYDELVDLEPHIADLLAKPVGEREDHVVSTVNLAASCPKLDKMNSELREHLTGIQRSIRNALNPSEVTFDLETAHPNLVLSEDLKTVTYSLKKQPYPSSPRRFTSFLQVLSTQSFSEGEHNWWVELDSSPWIIGVCHGDKLARSGMPSAMEGSSWCLMWFNHMLTAFEQGREVPLKKTPEARRRLEIRLSFKNHSLSFYNISDTQGKTHVYTFQSVLTEPVHLAYRMLTGMPKARVSVRS